MKLSQIVSGLLMILFATYGMATELTHHDHEHDDMHTESVNTTCCGHVSCQINAVTAITIEINPVVHSKSAGHSAPAVLPSPPLSSLDRPPEFAPVIV